MGGSSNNTVGRGIWWLTNNFAGQNSGDPVQDDLIALTQDAPQRLQFAGDTDGGNLTFNAAGDVIPVTASSTPPATSTASRLRRPAPARRSQSRTGNTAACSRQTVKIRISGTQTYVSGFTSSGNISSTIATTSLTVGGNYVLEVGSQGNYGDIGQYTITGNQTQFAAYDPASRTVTVGGFAGNNNVTLSVGFSNNQYQLLVQDSLNGGPTSSQMFLLSTVDSVSIGLGAGDDTLNSEGLIEPLGGRNIPIYLSMGGGFDTLKLGGGSSFENFNVASNVIGVTYAGNRTATFWNFDAERVELHGTIRQRHV